MISNQNQKRIRVTPPGSPTYGSIYGSVMTLVSVSSRMEMYQSALEWLATRIPLTEWLELLPAEAHLEAYLPAMERAFRHHHAPVVQGALLQECHEFAAGRL